MRVQTDHAKTFFPTETTGAAGSGRGLKQWVRQWEKVGVKGTGQEVKRLGVRRETSLPHWRMVVV